MSISRFILPLAVALIGCALARPATALSVTELREQLANGTAPMVIDIRSQRFYRSNHIPGAINVPASVIEHKDLRGFGRVVVCGDGIDEGETQAAVAALNAKPGIDAEILEGGFLAWVSGNGLVSRAAGMYPATVPSVTYEDLVRMQEQNQSVVLVDLRSPGRWVVELGVSFPGMSVLAPAPGTWKSYNSGNVKDHQLVGRGAMSSDALHVLVDDGNGQRAEAMARRLEGSGIRVAVLTGGGEIIARQGQESQKTVTTRVKAPK